MTIRKQKLRYILLEEKHANFFMINDLRVFLEAESIVHLAIFLIVTSTEEDRYMAFETDPTVIKYL